MLREAAGATKTTVLRAEAIYLRQTSRQPWVKSREELGGICRDRQGIGNVSRQGAFGNIPMRISASGSAAGGQYAFFVYA